ncbi:MAG: lamin tail domain-containing protein [Aeromicrobium sp.]
MLASPRRWSVPLLSALVLTSVAALSGPALAAPDPTKVRINEVKTNPGTDFVELVNTGSEAVDITGWTAVDNGVGRVPLVIAPAGTTIAPGGHYSFEPDVTGGFGLGGEDSITITGGGTQIDTYAWTTHRALASYGLCPGSTDLVLLPTATPGAANDCSPPDPTKVRINEIESNGDKVGDWVELTNIGGSTVDVSGWKILDNDAAHVATPVVIPANTTIAPGAFYSIYTEHNQTPGFGLGGVDSATLYLADGTTTVDTHAWTAHAPTTFGRCPDGVGAIRATTTSTRSASNACSPVRINEIESNDPAAGPDWVELTNVSAAAIDISGWVVKDSTDVGSYTFPAGSSLGANGYTTVDLGGELAGLGGADSVRLFDATGALAESHAWTTHAAQTYGRCRDGVGDFVDTTAATKGAVNACPGLPTDPWPGSQTVRTSDLAETFLQDLSGLAFDPSDPDVLWAAQNKLGTLFKLERSGQNWVPVTANGWGAGKTPTYTDGTGAPDSEGLTIGPDGFIYAASERNNAASSVSRMSVLRYDPDATGTTLTATDEWDLTGTIPAAGANLGLEGTTWIPDSFLTAGGFIDQSTNAPYKPSDYPLHGTGLFAVAVEATGAVHVFALDSTGGTSHLIATIASGFPNLADVTFDPERQRLWAVTDDTHDGKTSLLELKAGAFVVAEAYDRPVGMPNINNEGLAISPQSECVDGFKEVVWSSDGDDGGHSLRSGTITCTAPSTPVDPTDPVDPGTTVDTTAPYVRIGGVTRGGLYVGRVPTARCISSDSGSGVASCTISKRVTPTRTTLTARAVDRAGNVGTATTSYRTLAYRAKGATYRGGTFLLQRGKAYRLTGTVKESGRIHGPARLGTVAKPSSRLRNGSATVRIPRSARVGSTWKILVTTGARTHTVKVTVTR